MIYECMESRSYVEPRRLCILGRPGVGKTELCKTVAMPNINGRSVCMNDDGVVYVKTPASAFQKGIPTRILFALGDPFYGKGARDIQTIRIESVIEKRQFKLLIIDEFHHFIDRNNKEVLYEISDWLKNLSDNIRAGIILLGLPEAIEVLQVNEQLARRFSCVKTVEPFCWDSQEKMDEFCQFLKFFEGNLPFSAPSNLGDPTNMALRFFFATEGVADYVKKLISRGTKNALEAGHANLSLSALEAAYQSEMSFIFSDKQNPFQLDIDVSRLTADYTRLIAKRNERTARACKENPSAKFFGRGTK